MFFDDSTDGEAMVLPSTHKLRDENLGHGRCISIHSTPAERAMQIQNKKLKKDQAQMEQRMAKLESLLLAMTGGTQ